MNPSRPHIRVNTCAFSDEISPRNNRFQSLRTKFWSNGSSGLGIPLKCLSKSERIQELLKEAPLIDDFVDGQSMEYHNSLLAILDEANIDYIVNPLLVRGLDYYNQTVFEW